MEIDITRFVRRKQEMSKYSASMAEQGPAVGAITWQNALDCCRRRSLIPIPADKTARDYFRDFGAWEDDEISGWSFLELNALLLQMVAGSIREMAHYESRDAYGAAGGRVYQGDNGRWYYYIGH